MCALPEINPTDVVAALRKLTPVEIAEIGVGRRQIVLWWRREWEKFPEFLSLAISEAYRSFSGRAWVNCTTSLYQIQFISKIARLDV